MVQAIALSGELSAGLFVRFDDPYALLVADYSWHLKLSGVNGLRYARAYVRGSGRAGHRFIFMHTLITGWPRVDHEDGDGLNNTIRNLRKATQSQNLANQGSRGGASQYKGVYLDRRNGHWYACITVEGHQRRLGTFLDEAAAARAYDTAALAAWGDFARLNFRLGGTALPEANHDL